MAGDSDTSCKAQAAVCRRTYRNHRGLRPAIAKRIVSEAEARCKLTPLRIDNCVRNTGITRENETRWRSRVYSRLLPGMKRSQPIVTLVQREIRLPANSRIEREFARHLPGI